jgi:sterol 3beta-glucosyltransferase
MHISIMALGSRGDIQPYATLGQALVAAGHRVGFVTTENFAALIAAHSLEFHPIPGDAQALVTGAGANMRKLVRSFYTLARQTVAALDQIFPALAQTDAILSQLPGALYSYDLAQKLQRPLLMAAVIPLTATSAFPLMAFPRLPLPGYNKATYRLGTQIIWQLYRPIINRWRQNSLGLPKLSLAGYFHQLEKKAVPVLNGFSSHVVARPADWGNHVHITGYWFPQEQTWQPPERLLRFLAAGEPPVFIGFGSMPIKNPSRATQIILDALAQSGRRAVVQAGWGGLGHTALPDSIFPLDYAPYDWLFPRMAAVVHHGGSGTTAAGLRAGIPTLIVPFLFDQFYWGRRVAALGVGPTPLPFKHLSAQRLAGAINECVTDSAMRRRAAALGQKIEAEAGLTEAVRLIEAYLKA